MDVNLDSAALDGTGAFLLSVDGELDIATVDQLSKPAASVVRSARPLVLDLSRCSFIDSAGLRFVLQTHHALGEVGNGMAVVTEHPQVKKLLSVTGIDLRVRVFPGVDEAVVWLRDDGVKEAIAAQ
jgi:anti-sigma B factor antagonist